MRKTALFISFMCWMLGGMSQEQTELNTYMYSRQFINPATIASNEVLQGALIYKTQWVGLEGAPVSQFLNVNGTPFRRVPIHKMGLTVFNDAIGVTNTTDIAVDYAFKARLADKRFFSLSISPMLVLQQSDFGSIATDVENDPLFLGNSQSFTGLNVRLGFYYEQDDLVLGASIPKVFSNQLIQEAGAYKMNSTFDAAQLALVGHGGYKVRVNKYFTFMPSFLVEYETGQPMRIDLNGIFDYRNQFGGGISYRTLRNVSGVVFAQLSDQFKFAYSYNFNFGQIRTISSGSHEVQLIFGLFNRSVTPVNMHRLLLDQNKKETKKEEKAKKAKQKTKKSKNSFDFLQEAKEETTQKKEKESDEQSEAKKKESGKKESKKKKSKETEVQEEEKERQPYKQ